MKSRRITSGVVVTLALVALAAPAGAAPMISVSTPAPGATVSRSATPSLSVAGDVSFEVPAPVEQQYFLRHAPCSNASSDERSLAREWENSDASACGYNGTITPLNELAYQVGGPLGAPATEAYPMDAAELPLTLDATKPITGVLDVASFNLSGIGTGVGITTVDFVLRGTVGGSLQTIGTTSVSYQQVPGEVHKQVAWSITPPASFDKADFSTFELAYTVRGVNAAHGYVYYRGLSHVTVPIYTTSFDRRVQVAVDTGQFTSNGITVSEDLASFSGAITTPMPGVHTLKIRAAQGGNFSDVVQRTITVTA